MKVKALITKFNNCIERINTNDSQFVRLVDIETYRNYMKRYNLKLMKKHGSKYTYKDVYTMRQEIHDYELQEIKEKGLYVFDIDNWVYSHE